MAFKSVFISVLLGVATVVGALFVNGRRPAVEGNQPTAHSRSRPCFGQVRRVLAAIGLWVALPREPDTSGVA